MINPKNSPPSVGRLVYSGLLIGAYFGALFSFLSFALYGSASGPFLFGTRHAIHSYTYTVAIYGLLAGFAGVVIAALLWVVSRIIPLVRGRLLWILVVLPFAGLIPFVFANAKWQIQQPRDIALFDGYRLAFVQRSLLMSLGAGLVVAAILVLSLYRADLLRRGRWLHIGYLALILVVCLATLADMHLLTGRVAWERVEQVSQRESGGTQVLLVGLDGATWTVLQPLFREGKLPHLKKFAEDSALGPLSVYGKAYSPSVWTTVVTGVKRSRHGIVTHTVPGPEGTVLTGSTHRKVPAVWNVASHAGLKVGLINYMASFPPESVVGLNFSRVVPIGSVPLDKCIWPPELAPEVSQVLESVPSERYGGEGVAEMDHEVRVLNRLFKRYWDPSYSFFAWYTHSTDTIEHHYWRHMYPQSFIGTSFETSPAEASEKGGTICGHWQKVDEFFEYINSAVGPNTAVIVVSDHGMEAASAPEVHLSLNRLLAKLGLLVFDGSGEIDHSQSLAYWPTGSDVHLRATGVRINKLAASGGAGGALSFEDARDQVIEKLRGVRVAGAGRPLFNAVHRTEDELDPRYRDVLSAADVVIHLSAYTHGARLDDSLELGDEVIPLKDVLSIKTDVSGAHHPRGVIMARGSPFSAGPVFARPTVETPVSDVLQRMRGRSQRLQGLMDLAKSLGIIDRATTLDIAQTILYLLGLPAAEYMDGRVLAEGITREFISEHPGTLIADYGIGPSDRAEGEEMAPSPEELQRLRSIGYVE